MSRTGDWAIEQEERDREMGYSDDPFEGMSDEQEMECRRQWAEEEACREAQCREHEEFEVWLDSLGSVPGRFCMDPEDEARDRESFFPLISYEQTFYQVR